MLYLTGDRGSVANTSCVDEEIQDLATGGSFEAEQRAQYSLWDDDVLSSSFSRDCVQCGGYHNLCGTAGAIPASQIHT